MTLRRLQKAKKVEDMPMTKRRTTQTQRVNLPKDVKQMLAEIDWDLLEQMEMEEEGQPIPMQDFQPQEPPSPRFQTLPKDTPLPLRIDPPNGLLSFVPKR